jgi:hypothetical protein
VIRRTRCSAAPVALAGLAALLAAAFAVTPLMPVAVSAWSLACCALVLARRNSRPLRRALGAVAAWQVVSLAAALVFADRPVGGLSFVVVVLYLVPLPVIPWLYVATFEERGEGA